VPRWRGRLHAVAFVAAAVGTIVGVAAASPSQRLVLAFYGLGMTTMFGVSAAYHLRGGTHGPAGRHLQRLDHTAIYAAIVGTYTPICMLGVGGDAGHLTLVAVAVGAALGIAFAWSPWRLARRLNMLLYIAVGWAALPIMPALSSELGPWPAVLIVAGGLAYTAGAVALALRRPNPWPTVFGFHEFFHACTIVAAALQLTAITLIVAQA
jgi:hemolysin III